MFTWLVPSATAMQLGRAFKNLRLVLQYVSRGAHQIEKAPFPKRATSSFTACRASTIPKIICCFFSHGNFPKKKIKKKKRKRYESRVCHFIPCVKQWPQEKTRHKEGRANKNGYGASLCEALGSRRVAYLSQWTNSLHKKEGARRPGSELHIHIYGFNKGGWPF